MRLAIRIATEGVPSYNHYDLKQGCRMTIYRKGDQVAIRGRVQSVEGDFLMIALEGALDSSIPAMVSKTGTSLVRSSIHDGDEVAGGYRVHSSIPNTPLVLLQRINGDPADPESFSTAVRDSLTLVSMAGSQAVLAPTTTALVPPAEAAIPARGPATASGEPQAPAVVAVPEVGSAPAPMSATVPATCEDPVVATTIALEALADKFAGDTKAGSRESAPVEAPKSAPTPTPETSPSLRFSSIAGDALRSAGGLSIADLGVVREESNPLKADLDELLLKEPLEDETL
ncbi:hypothetical protein [Sphingomonas sp. 3-13AW]|uniref:hypothetical protein n=1 Tax=Sphingomonas sp. 3-13AW TaxID=3050450 RepID=UPI003BB5D0A1